MKQIFIALLIVLQVRGAVTVTLNEATTVSASPKRIGASMAALDNYDSGQFLKNLLGNINPGFEGTIYQQLVGSLPGTTTTAVNYNQYDQATANFWAGSTARFNASASGSSNLGLTRTITGNTVGVSGSGTVNTAGTAVTFASGNNFAGYVGSGVAITINGVNYFVATVTSNTLITLTTSAGTQTGVSYSYAIGPVYTFSPALTSAVAVDDYFQVTKQTNTTSTIGGWTLSGSAASESSDLPPSTQGFQALSLPASACATAFFDGGPSGVAHDYVIFQTGQTFGFSLKTKLISGSPAVNISIQRLSTPSGFSTNQTVTPTSSWSTQTISASGNESGSTGTGPIQVQICNSGTGTAYVDDVDFERTSNLDSTNTSIYRDEFVSAIRAMNPGVLRYWDSQPGTTLSDWTNGSFGEHSTNGFQAGYGIGGTIQPLGAFLTLCEVVGADAWITMPLAWPTTDYSNLMDYLGGGAGTTYGAKRIAGGGGVPAHSTTYISTLPHIYLEAGDEPWNSSFDGTNMPTYSFQYGFNYQRSYALWTNTLFGSIQGNANYSSSIVKSVINMQAATTQAYTASVVGVATNYDIVVIAPYIGSTMTTAATPTAEWNPDAAFAWGNSNSTSSNGWSLSYANVLPGGKTLGVYESALSSLAGLTQPVVAAHDASMIGGTIVIQMLLENLKIGATVQCTFQAAQEEVGNGGNNYPLWGGVKEAGGQFTGTGNYVDRPVWLAQQIANGSIMGTQYGSVLTGVDTYNSTASNGSAAESNVPYEFTYCFKSGTSRSCVLANTDPVNAHTFNFTGTNAPSTVTTRALTGAAISSNNESASPSVTIVTMSNVSTGSGISVPAGSMTALDWTVGGPQTGSSCSGCTFAGIVIH